MCRLHRSERHAPTAVKPAHGYSRAGSCAVCLCFKAQHMILWGKTRTAVLPVSDVLMSVRIMSVQIV